MSNMQVGEGRLVSGVRKRKGEWEVAPGCKARVTHVCFSRVRMTGAHCFNVDTSRCATSGCLKRNSKSAAFCVCFGVRLCVWCGGAFSHQERFFSDCVFCVRLPD